MYWWKSNRSRSRIPFSRTPGATPGWPTAPSRMASQPRSSLDRRVGQDLAGLAGSARRPGRTGSSSILEAVAAGRRRRGPPGPRAITSGPTPSPAITPILIKAASARHCRVIPIVHLAAIRSPIAESRVTIATRKSHDNRDGHGTHKRSAGEVTSPAAAGRCETLRSTSRPARENYVDNAGRSQKIR